MSTMNEIYRIPGELITLCSMASNKYRQEILEVEEEKPSLLQLLLQDNITSEQSKAQNVQLCRICFATDCKLYTMKIDKDLGQAYGTLTGLSIENEDNMPPYLCTECSHQLKQCIYFRNRVLRAHLLLIDILREHENITLEIVKTINENQNVSSSKMYEAHNPVDDLETVHIKKENIYTNKQISLTNMPSSFQNIVLDGIKKEVDDVINQDNPEDDDVSVSFSMHEDTVLDSSSFKAEKDDEYNEDSLNDDDTTSGMMYGVAFVGEDYLSEQRQARLSIAEVTEIMKTPKVLSQMKVNNTCRKRKCDENQKLLLYDKLCCDMCPYKTSSDKQLLRHIKAHTSTNSFKCNEKTNNRPKVPSTKKTFPCYICKKVLSTKCSLQKHIKTHSDEKQYTCDVCKKGFIESRDLLNHSRTHSGEKPYGCDLCKKSFSERGNLLRHIRIHAGEKPFLCKICHRSFNQRHHLKRHNMKKHF